MDGIATMRICRGSLAAMFAVETLLHLAVNSAKPISIATALGKSELPLQGELTAKMIVQVNLSAFVVCAAIAAVCFMFSGIFNSSKYSIGFSGAFVGVNILANMLSMFGSLGVGGLDKFKYLTICSFYDYRSVLFSGNEWVTKMVFPAVIAIVALTIGSVVFRKKDLPL